MLQLLGRKTALLEPYSKPPITEAVIDIRLSKPLKTSAVDTVRRSLVKNYDKSEAIQQAEIMFDVSGTASSRVEQTGYKLFNKDGSDIILSQKHGITVSRLAPYDGWEHFIERFTRDWEIWRKKVDPFEDICRLGVRYINRIDVPVADKKGVRIEDYFNISISTPNPDIELPEYLVRLVTPLPDSPFVLILNTSTIPALILNHGSFIFDIDIFCENQRATQGNLLETLDKMRAQKNAVFEAYLTSKAKELFR